MERSFQPQLGRISTSRDENIPLPYIDERTLSSQQLFPNTEQFSESFLTSEIEATILELVREGDLEFLTRLKEGLFDQDRLAIGVCEVVGSSCEHIPPRSLMIFLNKLEGLEASKELWSLSIAILKSPAHCEEIELVGRAARILKNSPYFTGIETMFALWERADKYGQGNSRCTPLESEANLEAEDMHAFDIAGASCIYLLTEHPHASLRIDSIELKAKALARKHAEAENHWLHPLARLAPEKVIAWNRGLQRQKSFVPLFKEIVDAELNYAGSMITGITSIVTGMQKGSPALIKGGIAFVVWAQVSSFLCLCGMVGGRVIKNSLSKSQQNQLDTKAQELLGGKENRPPGAV